MHYLWLRDDSEYVRAFENIQNDALEDEAARRAFAGSDTLLIFLLKSRRPERFKDKTQVEFTTDLSKPSPAQVEDVLTQLCAMRERKVAEMEREKALPPPGATVVETSVEASS